MNGVINVLKPTGMTSHDVVYQIRKKFNIQKVGHTGTLDPNVAGVLPITVGKGTKLTELLTKKDKSYRCQMSFGKKTDTLDSYGKVIEEREPKSHSLDEIKAAFESFLGDIKQTPPMYSAVKVGGRKLYNLARKGIEIQEIPKKDVTIHQIKIINHIENTVEFDISCSKGTYIRTIVEDVAEKLGELAYMNYLIRTGSGQFKIEDAIPVESITQEDVIGIDDIKIKGIKKIYLDNYQVKRYVNGMKMSREYIRPFENSDTNLYKIYDENNLLISIGQFKQDQLKNLIMIK